MITQEYAFCNFKYHLTNGVDVAYILTQYRNALTYHRKDYAKVFVSVLHIRIDMAFIDIYRKFFLMHLV